MRVKLLRFSISPCEAVESLQERICLALAQFYLKLFFMYRVVLTQPITALAFVWDGVLFGVSGFKYAATAMVGCAIPSVSLMYLAAFSYGNTNLQLSYVWSGLGLIMALRAAVIYLPYKLRRSPFDKLFAHKSNWVRLCGVNVPVWEYSLSDIWQTELCGKLNLDKWFKTSKWLAKQLYRVHREGKTSWI